MECDRSTQVWFGSKLGIKFSSNHSNFIDWLFHCVTTLNEEDLGYVAAIIYGIWWARNKQVFEDYNMEEKDILDYANSSVRDYQQSNKLENQHTNNNQHHARRHHTHNLRNAQQVKWRRPRTGVIKANCDANLSIDGWWGLGAVFRDENGEILASATWRLPDFNDPSTAEACALHNTVLMAIDCCFNRVAFEVDCANVANGVNNAGLNPISYFGNFLTSIQVNRAAFHQCSFTHIGRQANSVAHALAHLAHSVPNCTWMEDTHPSIVSTVFKDLF
ncbi:hypothetical protein QL285_013988 [Trifolium repens]|jgi:hypothetical protein|nr:hypothetical protein QL285_013988 [Trifolium repens]